MTSAATELADIQRQMHAVRESAGVEVHDLIVNAQAMTDWRRYWRRHPSLWCGAAAVLGYVLAPSRRDVKADPQLLAALAKATEGNRTAPRSRPIVSHLAGLALGVLIQQGKQMLAQRLASAFHGQTVHPGQPTTAERDGSAYEQSDQGTAANQNGGSQEIHPGDQADHRS
ncbi:MAG: hypothetical protein ACKV0T_07400 [Planctomycetales bacterium]